MSLRATLAGLWTCVLVPLGACLLPWRLFWPMARALSRGGDLFRAEADRACAVARAEGFARAPQSWMARHRLIRLVDLVDAALSGVRSDAWMKRHLRVEGDALPPGPCLFVGFHFGTGFWTLRHLRRNGHPVAFLSRPIVREEFANAPACHGFERWRMWQVARSGGAPVIFVGGSTEKMRQALRAGISVLGMVDVPPPLAPRGVPVTCLGREVRFPDGLLRLAEAEGVPVLGYVCHLGPDGGRRLVFRRAPESAANALKMLAEMLDAAIRVDPAAWHLWAEWPLFLRTGRQP